MSPSSPETVPPAPSIPSLPRRLVLGSLWLVLLMVLWVVLPYEVLTRLGTLGAVSSLDLSMIVIAGTLLAALGAARYVLKPTVAYGPVGVLRSSIATAYLVVLSQSARFTVGGPSQTSISLEYGHVLELLAIVPLFGIAAALVTTIEDLRRPGERLPFDYPPR